ncbi:PqqD family protein [bacterium]|nr:PqqD family protein [bacterium]RQV96015.1 MAG: PqqD family protein [bacterium]
MVAKLGIPPQVHIHLDEFGSFVWNHCDGSQSVSEIAQKLRERFGDKVDPVYERLGGYIRLLAYHKLITFKIKPDES